jgi:hypothetical protein
MWSSIPQNPSRATQIAMGCFALFVWVFRSLFGTLIGSLLVSVAFYAASERVLGLQPWTCLQLLLWFDSLDSSSKTAIATSTLTLVGFFVALNTTMVTWKKQTAAALRIAAADDIDKTITNLCQVLLSVQLFAEALAKEVTQIRSSQFPPASARRLTPLADDAVAFRDQRNRFFELAAEVNRLSTRYVTLFLPLPGAAETLEKISEALDPVRKQIWVQVPPTGSEAPDHRERLFSRADPDLLAKLAVTCDNVLDQVHQLKGGLRGGLYSTIVELNIFSAATLARLALFPRKE